MFILKLLIQILYSYLMQLVIFHQKLQNKNLDDIERDEVDAFLKKAAVLNVKEKGTTIFHNMSWCFVMFLREGKVNAVQYWWNILAKLMVILVKVVTLQLAQQPKAKNINVVPGQLFCRQCKAKFLLETDSLYWWSR